MGSYNKYQIPGIIGASLSIGAVASLVILYSSVASVYNLRYPFPLRTVMQSWTVFVSRRSRSLSPLQRMKGAYELWDSYRRIAIRSSSQKPEGKSLFHRGSVVVDGL